MSKKQPGVAVKSNLKLWNRCKSEAKSKMGNKWSARAAQYAVHLYKKRGGKYKGKKPTARTNKLKKWTKQKWMYLSDFRKKQKKKAYEEFLSAMIVLAKSSDNPGRYLPLEKWKSLSPSERDATNKKKKREGEKEQYVPNTEKARVRSSAKYYADDDLERGIDDYLKEFNL
jgi:hypothetical protein